MADAQSKYTDIVEPFRYNPQERLPGLVWFRFVGLLEAASYQNGSGYLLQLTPHPTRYGGYSTDSRYCSRLPSTCRIATVTRSPSSSFRVLYRNSNSFR